MMISFLGIIILSFASPVHALGVAPSREVVQYTTDEQTVNVRIINNEHKDMRVAVYTRGDLADYITAKKNTFDIKNTDDEVAFSYSVKLPTNLNPGPQKADIVIVEMPKDDTSENDQTMILSSVVVDHELVVNVPYPGSYAEGLLYVTDGNVNDTILFTANVMNKGSDAIKDIAGELIIKGPTNEEIARIKSTTLQDLQSKTSNKITAEWQANVNPGMYYAEFVVAYDNKQIVLRKTFMIGNFYVAVKDVNVEGFRLGAIAQFNIGLVS